MLPSYFLIVSFIDDIPRPWSLLSCLEVSMELLCILTGREEFSTVIFIYRLSDAILTVTNFSAVFSAASIALSIELQSILLLSTELILNGSVIWCAFTVYLMFFSAAFLYSTFNIESSAISLVYILFKGFADSFCILLKRPADS